MFTKGGYFQILLPGGFSKHASAERAHAKTNKKVATSAPRLPSRTFSFVWSPRKSFSGLRLV